MDHIGNSKEQQSLCYLTLHELSHSRQITHLRKELASQLGLFKWAVFSQVQALDFFLSVIFESVFGMQSAIDIWLLFLLCFGFVVFFFKGSLLVAGK